MFLLIILAVFPLASSLSVSVLRQCNSHCLSAELYCPDGHEVEIGSSLVCVDYLHLRPELVGLWLRFSGPNLTVHARVLRACFQNRVVGNCMGLHKSCKGGATLSLHFEHDGVEFHYTVCVYVRLKATLVGYRCAYGKNGFVCTKQFVAGSGRHHNLGLLNPGEGKTPEDDYDYDGEWFLWETPKPGSGYERFMNSTRSSTLS
ncbi:MAG: NS7b [Bat faecal coronavirus]|nr:MAG: NS7b [Bat faecal coronavirus]